MRSPTATGLHFSAVTAAITITPANGLHHGIASGVILANPVTRKGVASRPAMNHPIACRREEGFVCPSAKVITSSLVAVVDVLATKYWVFN